MSKAIFFDLDDTLVDTSESFDRVVCELVERYSGRSLEREALHGLRAGGGFNDDWDATVELLRLRGVAVERSAMASQGLELYLRYAHGCERLLVERPGLKRLGTVCPLFVVTGRVRAEYEPVWATRLDELFIEVVCRDDRDLPPKPSPALVLDLMSRHGISSGYFVGNSVDDMRAGCGAGLVAVGVATNQTPEALIEAGATLVERPGTLLERLSSLI